MYFSEFIKINNEVAAPFFFFVKLTCRSFEVFEFLHSVVPVKILRLWFVADFFSFLHMHCSKCFLCEAMHHHRKVCGLHQHSHQDNNSMSEIQRKPGGLSSDTGLSGGLSFQNIWFPRNLGAPCEECHFMAKESSAWKKFHEINMNMVCSREISSTLVPWAWFYTSKNPWTTQRIHIFLRPSQKMEKLAWRHTGQW